MQFNEDEWLRPSQVAELFRVDPARVRLWIRLDKWKKYGVTTMLDVESGHYFINKEQVYDLWSEMMDGKVFNE